ncbi:hypothetical protein [Aquabacter cavernae]|uniref:hypothetical protein n=1 Tax=Aquabacter cavernae TaxID=2496029 RepID=UPI000F8DDE14|nr:hypothetical protein [Aquabacter cavernae]
MGRVVGAGGCMLRVVLGLCVAAPAFAGAWTQKEFDGSAFFQTTATWSSKAFDGNGSLFDSRTYDKVSTQLFLEYGATDWLTLLAAPELLQIQMGAGTPGALDAAPARYAGFGYTDLGARVRLAHGEGWVVSAQGVLRIPGARPSEGIAALGYADGEIDLRLMAGLSFVLFGLPAFVDLEAAQRLREGAPPDEFRLDATLGLRVAPQWLLLAQSFNVVSEGAGQGPVFDVSYAYYKLQMGGMYDATAHLSFMLAGVTTWYARNAIQETGIVGAVLIRY